MRMCVLIFLGCAGHEDIFRIKGNEFEKGKEKEVSSDIAGVLLRDHGEKVFKLVKGKPTLPDVKGGTVKALARRQEEFREDFPIDPALQLEMVPQLSEETIKLLLGKPEPLNEAIEAGKLDTNEAPLAASVLWSLRREEPAKALARRIKAPVS